MTLKLIEFIKSHDNWRELLSAEPYSIDIKESGEYILFKYNQIESKFNDPVAFEVIRECRGTILRKDCFLPVCVPFFKFGNYGEGYADKLNWSTIRVEEKVDGNLVKIWHDKDEWHISTNGMISAYEAATPLGHKFADLFIEAFETEYGSFKEFCNKLEVEKTYMFELCHHLSRVVIKYPKPCVVHVGTRQNYTLQESNDNIGIRKPKEYSFNSIEEVIEVAKTLPYSEEGYVCLDSGYNRNKIKSPAYLAVHALKANGVVSFKRIMTLLFGNDHIEFLIYFPEFKPYFDKCEEKYKEYIDGIRTSISNIKDMKFISSKEDMKAYRKEYAMAVTKTPAADYFFKVLDGKYTWEEFDKYVRDNGAEKLVKVLNLKDEKVKEPEIAEE